MVGWLLDEGWRAKTSSPLNYHAIELKQCPTFYPVQFSISILLILLLLPSILSLLLLFILVDMR